MDRTRTVPSAAAGGLALPGVLVVERDEPVRALIRRLLEAEGFRVVEARSAHEALRLPARDARSLGLIVADIAEPGIAGVRGLRERLAPGARVLRLSVSGSDRRVGGGDQGNTFVLAGPFLANALAEKVRALLEARSPAQRSGEQPSKE